MAGNRQVPIIRGKELDLPHHLIYADEDKALASNMNLTALNASFYEAIGDEGEKGLAETDLCKETNHERKVEIKTELSSSYSNLAELSLFTKKQETYPDEKIMFQRYGYDLKAQVKNIIHSLNRNHLCNALDEAKDLYSLSNLDPLDMFTLFVPHGMRFIKSTFRLPNQKNINNENAKEILKDFLLNDSGDINSDSLKFKVVISLFGRGYQFDLQHYSHSEAKFLVGMVTEELGIKTDIAQLQPSKKQKMEERKDNIFHL